MARAFVRLRTQHDGAPFAEAWFLEACLPDGSGLWVRHTLTDGSHREAAVWAMHSGDQLTAHKLAFDLDTLAHGDGVLFAGGGARLTPDRAIGALGPLRWDLHLHGGPLRHRHVPALLTRLGLGRTYEPAWPQLRLTGTLQLHGRALPVDGAVGVLGHLYGRRNRVVWWGWAHATFDDGSVFECVSARLGHPQAPPITSILWHTPTQTWRWSGVRDLVRTRSTHTDTTWTLRARTGGTTLRARFTLPDRHVQARYHDPDGRTSCCRNSHRCRLVVQLDGPHGSTVQVTNRALGELGDRIDRPNPDVG